MLNMACILFRMTPEEALAGATQHAATALGMGDTHGSLEVGKVADLSPGRSIVPPTWPTGWAASLKNASCATASMSLFKESHCG